MLISTHRLISKALYKNIKKTYNIELNKSAFIYGSIKPDIVLSMKKMSHTKDGSEDFLYSLIENLQKKDLPLTSKELKKFSINLGVILHFLSDYFCQVHNSYDNLLTHFYYEYKLEVKFNNTNLTAICSKASEQMAVNKKNYDFSMKDYVNDKHKEYLLKPPEMQNDIQYCMEICTTASLIIINNCMKNNIYKIA